MGCIALDRVAKDRDFMEKQLENFVQTDTICYRHDSRATETLYARQIATWDPLNEWFAENYGGEKLQVTTGLGVNKQPEVAYAEVRKFIQNLCPWRLAAFDTITAVTKSIVISLAVANGHLTAEEACKACRLEEDYQAEVFGFVEGGHDWDVATTKVRLTSAAMVFRSMELEEEEGFECLMGALQEQDKIQ